MLGRRHGLSRNMLWLSAVYGRAQRWPCSVTVNDLLLSVDDHGQMFKTVIPRYYDLASYWPPLAA